MMYHKPPGLMPDSTQLGKASSGASRESPHAYLSPPGPAVAVPFCYSHQSLPPGPAVAVPCCSCHQFWPPGPAVAVSPCFSHQSCLPGCLLPSNINLPASLAQLGKCPVPGRWGTLFPLLLGHSWAVSLHCRCVLFAFSRRTKCIYSVTT